MWDEEDGFFYDVLRLPDGRSQRPWIRSTVRLLPLCAVTVFEGEFAGMHPEANETLTRVIENRNIAFRQISPLSKYCKVVAADDWLFPDCLERMVGLAEKYPSVAIVGAYGLAGAKVVWIGLPYSSTVVSGRQACRLRLLGGEYFFGAATAVLLRSEIVRSRPAFYNESNFHADSEACLEFLEHRDFGFVHQILTYRRDQEGSLSAFSKRSNTYLPAILYELMVYGPKYLTEDEHERRIREHLRDYYRYLGEQVYRRRGREFWSFHRGKLAALGCPLSSSRLAARATAYGLDLLLNPKRTVESALEAIRRRQSRVLEMAASEA